MYVDLTDRNLVLGMSDFIGDSPAFVDKRELIDDLSDVLASYGIDVGLLTADMDDDTEIIQLLLAQISARYGIAQYLRENDWDVVVHDHLRSRYGRVHI